MTPQWLADVTVAPAAVTETAKAAVHRLVLFGPLHLAILFVTVAARLGITRVGFQPGLPGLRGAGELDVPRA